MHCGGWASFHEAAEFLDATPVALFWEVCCHHTALFQLATSTDDFTEDEQYRYLPQQLIRAAGMHAMPFYQSGMMLGDVGPRSVGLVPVHLPPFVG